MALTVEEGTDLVRYARNVLEGYFTKVKPDVPSSLTEVFRQERGVFVTLHKGGELRGCIGFPEPTHPLGVAVEKAALSSALDDPRFPSLDEDELDSIVVEVSVLTKPELVEVDNPKEYVEKVQVGRDGLIAEKGWGRGLLLPQVPVEWNWDAHEYLRHTCRKAGLPETAWQDRDFKLYSFQAQIFSEESPGGGIVEKSIS